MDTMRSLCPVVRDEVMKLFDRVEVNGKTMFIPFERRILWIRESEAKIMWRHDDDLVGVESERLALRGEHADGAAF